MSRRRNTDDAWRRYWREAGTGDLQAARLLVRELERAGGQTEQVDLIPSMEPVLDEPITAARLRSLYEAMGNEVKPVTGVVRVDLGEVIDLNLEGFLDLLSERLTGTPLLGDIQYQVVGLGRSEDELLIRVSGDVTQIVDDMGDEPACPCCNTPGADSPEQCGTCQTIARGAPVCGGPRNYTLRELRAMPTIDSGHFDDVKFEDSGWRVSLSRMTRADGAECDNQVTVERYIDGQWVTHHVYRPRAR